MQTPILETERLILRPLTVQDAQDIYDRWTSDERVAKYMRWSTHKSVEETKEWLLMEEEGNSKAEHYNWGFVLKSTGELIGCGGIFYNKDKCAYELGYNTMYDYWRQGYTTEAAKRMLDFGIQQLGVYEYVCCHATDNPASGAVMRKCGFEYEKDCVSEKFDGSVKFPSKQYRLRVDNGVSLFETTLNTRRILKNSLRYIRSDVPTTLTEKDIKWLIHNNIRTIIDLREERERVAKKCPLADNTDFDYICLPVSGGNTIPAMPAEVSASYVSMVDDNMQRIIDTLENATTNVLYFCNAGKDRTGVVSALLLKRRGYDDEYIVNDYMKSASNLKNMLVTYAESNLNVDINVITPHREYMWEMLARLDVDL
ncbi:MAG: GNAT family N-acetyltransferase [Lachnospira sp.]|nr:GNAT family N-acetyltransferase [Lachnospira sp.]